MKRKQFLLLMINSFTASFKLDQLPACLLESNQTFLDTLFAVPGGRGPSLPKGVNPAATDSFPSKKIFAKLKYNF